MFSLLTCPQYVLFTIGWDRLIAPPFAGPNADKAKPASTALQKSKKPISRRSSISSAGGSIDGSEDSEDNEPGQLVQVIFRSPPTGKITGATYAWGRHVSFHARDTTVQLFSNGRRIR